MTVYTEQDLYTISYCSNLYRLKGSYISHSPLQAISISVLKKTYSELSDAKKAKNLDSILSFIFKKELPYFFDLDSLNPNQYNIIKKYVFLFFYSFKTHFPIENWVFIFSDINLHQLYKDDNYSFKIDLILRKRFDKRLNFQAITFPVFSDSYNPDLESFKYFLLFKTLKSTIRARNLNYSLSYFPNISLLTENKLNKVVDKTHSFSTIKYSDSFDYETFFDNILLSKKSPKRILCLSKECPKYKECQHDI